MQDGVFFAEYPTILICVGLPTGTRRQTTKVPRQIEFESTLAYRMFKRKQGCTGIALALSVQWFSGCLFRGLECCSGTPDPPPHSAGLIQPAPNQDSGMFVFIPLLSSSFPFHQQRDGGGGARLQEVQIWLSGNHSGLPWEGGCKQGQLVDFFFQQWCEVPFF